ncbi:MAG TPA: HNH endonuclease [Firmicutes bacterium]|nr:HNH endonuclease [Bacillota bacterium]
MDSDKHVLLLNSTFEPLTVLRERRALKLIFEKKAYVVEDSGVFLHTVRHKLKLPSVVQLLYYVKKPYKKPKFSKKAIFIRDNFRCQYCKTYVSKPTIDHVIPKSKNGPTTWTNVVTACHKCNNKKGDRTLKESGMKLLKFPQTPKYIIIHGFSGTKNIKKWEKYFNPGEQKKSLTYNAHFSAALPVLEQNA